MKPDETEALLQYETAMQTARQDRATAREAAELRYLDTAAAAEVRRDRALLEADSRFREAEQKALADFNASVPEARERMKTAAAEFTLPNH